MKYPTIFNFILFIVIVGFLGCSLLEEPEDISNPMDPSDPDFTFPYVTFLDAPTNGEIMDTCFVRFEWEGNQVDMNYSYRTDEGIWSGWSPDESVEYPFLDEGDHLFEIISRYYNGVESEESQVLSFQVDDVEGPALMFYPRSIEVASDSIFFLEILIEGVTDLTGVKAIIDFDCTILNIQNIQIFDDERSLLLKNGGTLISFCEYNNSDGTIKIESGVATGNPPFVDGSGLIARITLSSTRTGTTTLQYNILSEMRDSNNTTIEILETVAAHVRVK